MIKYIVCFFSALLLSFLITPLVRILAQRLKVLDLPSPRKIHKSPIPLLGGIPIFISFNLVLILGVVFRIIDLKESMLSRWPLFFLCQAIVLATGIYDDIKKLQPRIKFLFQILAGELLIVCGFLILAIKNPFSGKTIELGFWSIPVTIIWIVGITNALNLVDGLDGLAAGIALITTATIFVIALYLQTYGIALVASVLAGSILGFLRYNFHPAKIFLGDSGSLLLGFMLAVLSVEGSFKGAVVITVLAPILALGLPIMDTFLSMTRRFLASVKLVKIPEKKGKVKILFFRKFALFEADKNHVHHRLLGFGLSQRTAVLVLYLVCGLLCGLAVLSVMITNFNMTLFLAAVVISFFIGIRTLKYEEFHFFDKGMLLPLFNNPWLDRRFFVAFLDFVFISTSYFLSFLLLFGDLNAKTRRFYLFTLPLVLVVKLVCFFLARIYRISWKYVGLEDILRVAKALLISSVSSFAILATAFGLKAFNGLVFFVLDFYLLSSFVVGARASYRILDSYYMRRRRKEEKQIIIYGAGRKASLLLREIKHSGRQTVGFLDDDPAKKGKIQHGCPILGTLKELGQILGKNEVAEVILSTPKIEKDRIARLIEICRERGIEVKQFDFSFDQILK
jgi:UDP-GlcNAc:undecaprenyl-phosphate/decaprenyl-phosphate GlcNAc-1-phosphate transferase